MEAISSLLIIIFLVLSKDMMTKVMLKDAVHRRLTLKYYIEQ